MNPGITILLLPSAKAFSEGGWTGQLLKTDESQVGQRHEDMERKREYYHITIFTERS